MAFVSASWPSSEGASRNGETVARRISRRDSKRDMFTRLAHGTGPMRLRNTTEGSAHPEGCYRQEAA